VDQRLQLSDPPRELPPGLAADQPLITVAWRAMQREFQRIEARQRREASEDRALDAAFVALGDELFQWEKAGHRDGAERMRTALAMAGVGVPRPEGESFVEPWIDLFENIATLPQTGIEIARIAEVVSPAVLRHGLLLRRGKAVIAVPAPEEKKPPGGE
jgi:hypothetical protein